MTKYTVRRCAKCGLRASQPEMYRTSIRTESGHSKRSLSNRELLFAAAGSKNARKSIWRWATSPNKRTHFRTREVWLCADCAGVRQTAPDDLAKEPTKKGRKRWLLLGVLVFVMYKVATVPSPENHDQVATTSSPTNKLTYFPGWCAGAQSETEITICASELLAHLDTEMSDLFFATKSSASSNSLASFMQRQQAWLRERNSCGSNVDCLISAYEGRISELGSQVSK